MLNFPGNGSFVGQEKYRIPDQEGNDLQWQIRFPQRCGLLAVSPKCIVLSANFIAISRKFILSFLSTFTLRD